ncbi:hypothetical protein BDR05DRAFT_1006280 [Suillus weaverae]|nr:hypothetical protein BDR05DRAFT_1006280 [Suillus weaverae]
MAPKRAAKVGKLPRKKAKVGGIFSGISRAAPGEVDTGSMVPGQLGHFAPLKISTTPTIVPTISALAAPSSSSDPVSVGIFCHFCCDQSNPPHQHECVECGAIVCEQYLPRSSGCIFLNTVEVGKEAFLCPMCSRIGDAKNAPLPYAFIGFGRRKKVKMAWPMAIINLNLESMKDDYLALTVKLEVENHYRSFPNNVFVSTLRMRGAAHISESKKLAPGVEFMRRNIKAGFPPNTFVIIDTHSDEYTGMLQHTGGHTGGTSTTVSEIMMAYLGNEFLSGMQAASTAARCDQTASKTVSGKEPWCNLTARVRGGWRGVFMVSCGPAIRVSHHFEEVKALVRNHFVDFVLAFGGSGTLPSMVATTVRTFLLEIGVFGRTDVWSALCDTLASSNDLLDYTTAVLVYANTVNNQRVVECRQIAKDIPGVRAFGYEFKSCATPGCHPAPADMRVYNRGVKVHLRCLKCHWRSVPVKTDEDNKYFKRVNKVLSPQLFWHHFPPSTGLQNYFVEASAGLENTEAAATSQERKNRNGVDNKGKGKCRDIAKDIKQEDSEMAEYRLHRLPMNLD